VLVALIALLLVSGIGTAGAVMLIKHRHQAPALTPEDQFDMDLATALAARTVALRTKNEKAFLAAVDPTRTDLAAQQRQTFRNLVQFTLIEPTYRLADGMASIPSSSVPGARDALVSLEHRLGAADTAPVALSYREIWQRRGSALALVGAAPKDGPENAGKANPIDLAPLRVVGGGMVTVVASPSVPAARVASIDALAETSAAAVRRMWGTRPGPAGFVVFLAATPSQIKTWFGGIRGVDYTGYAVPQRAARKGTTYAGARVVVDLNKSRAKVDLATTLRHEFTHAQAVGVQVVPTFPSIDAPYPTWAEEGFASWSEEMDAPLARSRRLASLRALSRQGFVSTEFPPSQQWSFYTSNAKFTEVNYAKAAMIFRYVAVTYRTEKAIAFYIRIASGQQGSAQAVLGVSREAFEATWTAWLIRQIRGTG
jgi:hypothetical protein